MSSLALLRGPDNDVGDDDQAILGFVWVTGGDNLAALKNQVDDTEVWNE